MPDTFEPYVVRQAGLTLSKIIWRRFRRPVEGVREKTLDHNPGLAALRTFLPVGTKFEIVIPGPEDEKLVVPLRRLWGTG